jgi:hypothetical protein
VTIVVVEFGNFMGAGSGFFCAAFSIVATAG